MINANDRYEKALKRNLNELGRAILERRAMLGLEQAGTYHSMDFVRLSYDALFNDYIAHAIKVLENSNVSSFWYLKRCKRVEVANFCKHKGIDLRKLKQISDSLKIIRNKTHFHIDRDYVKNCALAWKEESLKGSYLSKAIDDVWLIVRFLYQKHFGKEFHLPDYDGSDAGKVAKYIEEINQS